MSLWLLEKLLKQIYGKKTCPLHDSDCFFLCQGYYWWLATRCEGPSGAIVTHHNISCFIIKNLKLLKHFNSLSRYNFDNHYFEDTVGKMYLPELLLNKANESDTEAPILDLHLFISNGFVSSKIHDKRDDFDGDMVNFPFWIGTFPIQPFMGFKLLNYSIC